MSFTSAAGFSLDELFFSTTDAKGIIRSSNDVFLRVSGHPRGELVGRAHNRVRHPDMPRAIFRLFWDALSSGRPIAAYVQNRAADGSGYWVMASAVPAPGGYLSVRCTPTTEHFRVAQRMYERLRAVEREVEGDDVRRRKPSIEASLELLPELLAEAGHASYEAFMHAALPAEVASRERLLGQGARDRVGAPPPGADPGLAAVLEHCASTHDFLDDMVAGLARYMTLGETLEAKSRFVLDLAGDIRLFSLNALFASARVGRDGAALAAVADLMRASSDRTGPDIRALHGELTGTVAGVGELGLRIAVAKLQAEMLMRFVHELMDGAEEIDAAAELEPLAACLSAGVARLLESVVDLDERLHALGGRVAAVAGGLDQLRALEINGRIEAARAAGSADVRELFQSIGRQVATARGEIREFAAATRLDLRQSRDREEAVRRDVGAVCERVHLLAA